MSTIKYETRGFKIGDTVYIPRFSVVTENMTGYRECIINSFSVETLVEKKANRVYTKSKVFANVTWIRNGEHSKHLISELYTTRRDAYKRSREEYKAFIREQHGREITRQEREIEKCEQMIKDYKKDIKGMQKVLNSL